MPDVLEAFVVFVAEHRVCGVLDGGQDNGRVWLQCSCGARVEHPIRPNAAAPLLSGNCDGAR
jgi:hypothetical protein